MTLIVARKHGDEILIVADTLITSPGSIARDRSEELKLFVLFGKTIIGIAGDPDGCRGDIRRFVSEIKGYKFKDIAHWFCQKELHGDFIIVFDNQIISVKDGVVNQGCASAWVGDVGGFSKFQEYFERARGASFPMEDAMSGVIYDQSVASVGGNCVSAGMKGGVAKYGLVLGLVSPNIREVKPNSWNAIDFGRAEDGGFGFSTLRPKDENKGGWGIYYFQSKYGKFYQYDYISNEFNVHCGYANNVVEFCELLKERVCYEVEHAGSLGQGS